MNLDFIEASSLAVIDHQLEHSNRQLKASEYEIIRQVIYHTADFEYESILKFNNGALSKGAAAITACSPIVVDVPEIQVSIVPKLQGSFRNPVYCAATKATQTSKTKTKTAYGLETLASKHPQAIFIVGQDATALQTLAELIKYKTINPSLAIATAPLLINSEQKSSLINSSIPLIYVDSIKGGATVASAIFKSLLRLTWQAYQQDN
ncbi:precorrin-8X methylmutase [Chondrocystis sp. NIES-4102]|nr:precorrin-8X methylmutase [Chondrocystis sp. NIES-4102]